MEEQASNSFPPPARQTSGSLQEDLLLSPKQAIQLEEQGPTLHSLTASIPLQQLEPPRYTHQDKKLDDSLLLSGNNQERSAGLALSINTFQIEPPAHSQIINPQQQTIIQPQHDLTGQNTHFERELTLKRQVQVDLSKRTSSDAKLSQHQTIFQSKHNINQTHISSYLTNQPHQKSPDRIFSQKKGNLNSNDPQLLKSLHPSENFTTEHHAQSPRQPPLIPTDKLTRSQEQLLGLLSSFTRKLLLKCQQPAPQHQSLIFERDDTPLQAEQEAKNQCQTSMIVHYSDQKRLRQSFKEGSLEEAIFDPMQPNSTNLSQPMEIQQPLLNYKRSQEPTSQFQLNNQPLVPIEIETKCSNQKSNAEEIQSQNNQHQDRNIFNMLSQNNNRHIYPFQESPKVTKEYPGQYPENNKHSEIDKVHELSYNQQIGQETYGGLNESRNFSIEVNVNQDSLPQCLQKSLDSVNEPHNKSFTNEVQNSTFYVYAPGSLQQASKIKLNSHDLDSINHKNFKHTYHHYPETIQEPYVQAKAQLDHEQSNQLQIKTDHRNMYQGVVELINLDQTTMQQPLKGSPNAEINHNQLQHCKVLNQSSTLRDTTHQSAAIQGENVNLLSATHQNSANYSQAPSRQPQGLFCQNDNHSIESQSEFVLNRLQQKQTNEPSHNVADNQKRPIQRKEVDLQQIKQENAFKKAPVPMVPPCITINISRDHQISLNIYNNHPFVQSPHSIKQPPATLKEDKSVQNESNLISNNQTFVEEAVPVNTTARKVQCKKERRFVTNASIDLEKESETEGQKYINLDLEPQSTIKNTQPSRQPFKQSSKQCDAAKSSEDIQQMYLKICQQAEKYLLNTNPDEAAHHYFQELLKPHISPRLSTEPISVVGNLLFKNGLVLVSIVKLYVRQTKTPFLANYIFEHFSSAFSVQQSKYLFEEKVKKAKEQYINYLDQQYQEVYIKNKEINLQKTDNNCSQASIKRVSIRQPIENQSNFQSISVQKPKKLMLNSNFYSLSERPLPEALRESKNKRIQPSDNYSKQRKQGSIVQNVIHQSNEKSSQSSIEIDKRDYQKRSIEKNYSSMNRERQYSSNSVPKAPADVSKQAEKVQEHKAESNIKSRVVDNNHQPSESKIVEHQNLISTEVPGARFDELYKRYKKIRESIRVSGSVKAEEPSGILKPSSSDSKERPAEADNKKKKNVQFLDDPIQSKEHSNGQEALAKKNKKKKTKPKVQSSLEEATEEVTTRNRTSKR